MTHEAVSVGYPGSLVLEVGIASAQLSWGVILSDEVAAATEESKDPYSAYSLSPGMIFVGAGSRRNPLAAKQSPTRQGPHCDFWQL
jgi:hypothetical protein